MTKPLGYRTCKNCGQGRPLIDFRVYNKATGARRHECAQCQQNRINAQYWKNPEVKRQASARRYVARPWSHWDDAAKQQHRERQNGYRRGHLQEVFNHYGARCACCGETEPMFLTVDHVNNDGYLLRKANGRRAVEAGSLYRLIIRQGFPEDYQVLCYNCNCGKHRNGGVCPHHVTEGSTTIPSGSRAKRPEAPSTPKGVMI